MINWSFPEQILYIKHDRINLDQYWENLVLGLVGETIDSDGNEICGAVISRRRAGENIVFIELASLSICHYQPIVYQCGIALRQIKTK